MILTLELDSYEIGKEKLDVEEARKLLSSYISSVTRRALKYVRDNEYDDHLALINQIQTCNEIIAILSEKLDDKEFNSLQITEEGEVLTSLYSKINTVRSIKKGEVIRPITPISQSSLFTGTNYDPNMLVSFIKWSGLRCIMEELKTFTEKRDGKLRVITTSYMEATSCTKIMPRISFPMAWIFMPFLLYHPLNSERL